MLRRRGLIGAAGLSLAAPALAAPRKKPEVQLAVAETTRGRVRGVITDGIRSFKGIPYGASTAGVNRFLAARPAPAWGGIRDATAYGPMCPQDVPPASPLAASWAAEQPMSEDCLTLNVWTPALRDYHKRPVMVWFHGGGFASGTAGLSVSDGTNLAKKGDVVVISVNHRLNVFGHLYLTRLGGAEFAESGNLGILDLAAALRWIHANVAEFGGDPANITVFGQGGGGAKVSMLMAMPQTRGLFHRAIVQSGSRLDGLTPDEANAAAQQFLRAVDVPANDLTRLQKLPFDMILAALRRLARGPGQKPSFGPVVDGRYLPKNPWSPEGPAFSAAIPMLIGSTRTETTSLIGARDPSVFNLDDADLRKRLTEWVPAGDLDKIIAGYRRLGGETTAAGLFFAITTARRFRQQAWAQADRKAAQNSGQVWLYELDWPTPVDGGKWRSPHGLDVPLVFDNVANAASMTGAEEAARSMAAQISASWLAFARTGNPNNKAIPTWTAFRAPEHATMLFDTKTRLANNFRDDERALLGSLPLIRVRD
jgi:para-nitrobenzyl esterase